MRFLVFAVLALASLCACGSAGSQSVQAAAPGAIVPASTARRDTPDMDSTGASGTIQHVVVIIQENRSLDNLFQGFPNANTRNYGYVKRPGNAPMQVRLGQVPLAVTCDIDHSHTSWAADWDNGKMDGFDQSNAHIACTSEPTPYPRNYAYSYVNPSDVAPYWDMAKRYTLMDNVFEDPTSPSFESHQHLIAGQSENTAENPQINNVVQTIWGCDSPPATRAPLYNGQGDKSPGIYPCFAAPYPTIADLLDGRGLNWKYYAPQIGASGDIWSAFDAVSRVRYGPDWAKVISPETSILTQAADIPSVTYVVPSFPNSDHASSNSKSGPAWVASVVNAIGQSPRWNTTAIFVLWDDWGGWYDHVAPPVNNTFTIGGFRVPVICISPYSENPSPSSPVVDHAQHGTDGILSYIEQNFNLGNLGGQDAVDSPLSDCFNFKQKPKPFIPIAVPAPYDTTYFLHQPVSNTVPDTE